ncbi:GNAT family N-acetyltransferase [Shewanella eurypsychrophilus]|uniref:GNAT family N-acetyltransferase n=1 Tax=Shewanella eurypsychrophilus TaxID=2593656 RepID=A0ABX6V4G0_9GAMM|nr:MULTISPECIES: GNAT family N-acetyltransferase [Shewanella]QFU21897.1 GNAT family N-acetyltransferase [Shewanella sp. YLB-09]QPG57186.1 GNAT family N-acetyltransferase [Shewanella eurypsychrophilus]
MTYQINFQQTLTDDEQQMLWDGIEQASRAKVGTTGRNELCFLLRDEQGKVLGGVQGNCDNFGWLWIDSLWVSESLRGKGLGQQLLQAIEGQSIELGCTHSHLTSFTYQAVDFYKQHGYSIFGELENYPQGHSRCWMKKVLVNQ